jgi:AraC-like DNA-binding protein
LRAVDRVVRRAGFVLAGAFRCPRGHPLFSDSGPIENDVFVFPRTRVTIAHAGGRRFTADPAVVTLYNRGQLYARGAVDERGDHSDYFAVDRALALELARARDPDVGDRPFRFPHAPSTARSYLRQRALFERLARGEPVGDLELEEEVVGLLESVLESAYGARGPALAAEGGDDEEVVQRARLALGSRLAESPSLASVAREVGVSRSRLCRVFRQRTGATLHAYREQLRLRAALAALGSRREDLSALAHSFGYSSHSHFSASFKRAFGLPPSEARARLSGAARPPAPPRTPTRAPS